MLHIPNSAEGNCLTGKENHTLCLKSDIKSINLEIIVKIQSHNQYTNPLTRPLLIALQVVQTSFAFYLRECMGSSPPPPGPKRLIYKQFVEVSRLCGSQFLCYLPKRFTHLCRALYGGIWRRHTSGQLWPPEINKNTCSSLSYKSSFFSLQSLHTCA